MTTVIKIKIMMITVIIVRIDGDQVTKLRQNNARAHVWLPRFKTQTSSCEAWSLYSHPLHQHRLPLPTTNDLSLNLKRNTPKCRIAWTSGPGLHAQAPWSGSGSWLPHN